MFVWSTRVHPNCGVASQRQVLEGVCWGGKVNLHTGFPAVKSQSAYTALHDSCDNGRNLSVDRACLLLSLRHAVATQLSKQGRRHILSVSAEMHSSVWASCFPNMAWFELTVCQNVARKMHAQHSWLNVAALMKKQPVSLLDSEVNFSLLVAVHVLVLL